MSNPGSGVVSPTTPGRPRWWHRVAGWSRRVAWRNLLVHLTILTVLALAFVTSFASGSDGAKILGFPPEFLFTAPLICDIVAGLATLVHGWARDDAEMRRLATWFVMAPMVLSWAANAVDHVGRVSPDLAWSPAARNAAFAGVILFAGLCPGAVAALLFFSTKFGEFERRCARRVAVKPEITATKPEAVAVTSNAETPVEAEPEFVEPPLRHLPVASQPAVEIDEFDAAEIDKFDAEMATFDAEQLVEVEVVRVMDTTKPKVPREIAEIMVREDVSRATAYRYRDRKRRETGDAALA